MFIRPTNDDLLDFQPDFTIINASDVEDVDYIRHGLNSKTFVIFNLKKKLLLLEELNMVER